MTIAILRDLLFWSAIIHIGLLLWWLLFFMFARNLIYRMHTRWFKLSDETFDAVHYGGMAFYKICIWVFAIAPYFALLIISP